MSGTVVVAGDASQSAGATGPRRPAGDQGQRLGPLRDLDEGRRHRRPRLDRATSAASWRSGARWSSAATRARTSATRSTRPASTCAGEVAEPRRRLRREGDARRAPRRARRAARARARPTSTRPSSAATAPPASSTTSRSTTRASTDDRVRRPAQGGGLRPELADRWRPGLRESALFDRNAIHEIHRMAREGIYDIRGFGAKRRVPHFDDLLFLGASVSRYPLEGYRERCATDVTLGHPLREGADPPRDPDHDRRDELRRPLGPGQGGARARRQRGGDQHDHRRRRHAARGARALEQARLPDPALALRDEPRRPAPRRRGRGRGRPGREARRRRDAARAEDLRPGRRDARPAEGHRPAQRLPPPRLDRARRPRDQDRRAARDHRLARSRSTSRSAPPAPTSTSLSRSRPAPT